MKEQQKQGIMMMGTALLGILLIVSGLTSAYTNDDVSSMVINAQNTHSTQGLTAEDILRLQQQVEQ